MLSTYSPADVLVSSCRRQPSFPYCLGVSKTWGRRLACPGVIDLAEA
jgi:hypothetical protein